MPHLFISNRRGQASGFAHECAPYLNDSIPCTLVIVQAAMEFFYPE
jgi:hypothetical protein